MLGQGRRSAAAKAGRSHRFHPCTVSYLTLSRSSTLSAKDTMILLYLPQEHSKRLCPLSQSHYQLVELRVVG